MSEVGGDDTDDIASCPCPLSPTQVWRRSQGCDSSHRAALAHCLRHKLSSGPHNRPYASTAHIPASLGITTTRHTRSTCMRARRPWLRGQQAQRTPRALAVVVLIAAAAYLNTLIGDFTFDDNFALVRACGGAARFASCTHASTPVTCRVCVCLCVCAADHKRRRHVRWRAHLAAVQARLLVRAACAWCAVRSPRRVACDCCAPPTRSLAVQGPGH